MNYGSGVSGKTGQYAESQWITDEVMALVRMRRSVLGSLSHYSRESKVSSLRFPGIRIWVLGFPPMWTRWGYGPFHQLEGMLRSIVPVGGFMMERLKECTVRCTPEPERYIPVRFLTKETVGSCRMMMPNPWRNL